MKNGIVFIWSEKELLHDIIKVMEKKEFVYIENLVMVMLDPMKAMMQKEVSSAKAGVAEEVKIAKTGRGRKAVVADTASSESDTTAHTMTKNSDFSEKDRAQVALDQKIFLDQLHQYSGLEANDLFLEKESDYFKSSKRTLLFFRKVVEGTNKTLELRHQRTCDIFFNTVNPMDPYGKYIKQTKLYI